MSQDKDSLHALTTHVREFVQARDWEQFHSPKNLAMAMIVEAAELVEIFQWETVQQSYEMNEKKRQLISHELADTFVYLLRLADVMGIDLIQAAYEKIQLNGQKYPVDKAKGSNAKYTEYE